MKLNLGCGNKHLDGWLNVDHHPPADKLWNLELLPWPWEDNSVDEVQMIHVLEHLGQPKDLYLEIIKQLYRVCRSDAVIRISVPHPRHDDFLNDPTHVRAITAESMSLFNQDENRRKVAEGYSDTPLGVQLGVNLKLEHVRYVLDPDVKRDGNVEYRMVHQNNIIKQIEMTLRVVK